MARWRSGDAADCKSVHPGSIPGHVAAQDIYKLGKLVNAGRADDLAERRDPIVVALGLDDLRTVLLTPHRAELEDRKGLTVQPAAGLPEQHRTGRLELDQNSDESEERREEQQSAARDQNIHRSF